MTITAPTWTDAACRPWPAPDFSTRAAARTRTTARSVASFGAPVAASPAWHRGVLLTRMSPARQVITALAMMLLLQIAALPAQDPVYDVVSFLAYAPGGMVLFPLATGLIALAAAAWATQLSRAGRLWAARLAAAASASLMLLGAFPTDPPGIADPSLPSLIHRYAALAMFVAIPAAAILTARGCPTSSADPATRGRLRALHACVTLCLLSAGPALVAVFPTLLPDSWHSITLACDAVRGLVERIQLVTMTVIVILGVALSHGERRAGRADPAPGSVIDVSTGDPMTGRSGGFDTAPMRAGRKRGGLDPLSRTARTATMVS